jgi:hypothetical protein
MLIDSNAYVGQWPFSQRRNNTCDGLLQRMNHFGVNISCISNLNGIFYKNTQAANEELYEEMKSEKRFYNRLVPFAVINPIYAGWKHDLEICHTEMGMKGIRLHPQYHGYELKNPFCVELVKMARDRDLVVAFSLRMVDSRPSSWMDLPIKKEWTLKDIVPIIKEVPDAKYLIVNVANSTQLSDEETALFKEASIVMDTSGRAITNLGELLQIFGKDKFAFGSHTPILDNLTGLLRIESLRESESGEATKELLRSGNIKRLLNL